VQLFPGSGVIKMMSDNRDNNDPQGGALILVVFSLSVCALCQYCVPSYIR